MAQSKSLCAIFASPPHAIATFFNFFTKKVVLCRFL